jgi:co-chaperonin GroES (HSP10)
VSKAATKKAATKKAARKSGGSEKALAGHSLDLKTLEESYGIVHSSDQDAIDWVNDEKTPLPDPGTLIAPFGWKILVMPMRPAMVSKGGIIIPQVRQDTDQYLNYIGRIVSMGPLAYKQRRWADMGLKPEHEPKIGDWVIYPIYQYARIDFKGRKLILLNDDSFLAIVPKGVSPWDFRLER